MTVTLSAVLFYAGQRQAASVALIREGMGVAARVGAVMRPGVAHDRLAAFFAGARQVVSAETAAAHHTEAVADDRHPGLRGDPLSPDVVSIVKLIRPTPVDRGPWGGAS